MELLEKINGKKTYILAVLTVVYAISGGLLGNLEVLEAVNMVLAACGLGFLRHGVSQNGKGK